MLSPTVLASDASAYGRAYWNYIRCNEDAARTLLRIEIDQRESGFILRARPDEALAIEAMTMCKSKEGELAPLIPGGVPSEFLVKMQQFNAGTIKAERLFLKQGLVCAGAEWAGCSMKAIPNWKGVSP